MSWTTERARVASLSRSRTPDDPDLVAARRNLRAERLAEHIAAQVAAWPQLTDAQLDRLAVLLRPEAAAGGVSRRRAREATETAEAELAALAGGAA